MRQTLPKLEHYVNSLYEITYTLIMYILYTYIEANLYGIRYDYIYIPIFSNKVKFEDNLSISFKFSIYMSTISAHI